MICHRQHCNYQYVLNMMQHAISSCIKRKEMWKAGAVRRLLSLYQSLHSVCGQSPQYNMPAPPYSAQYRHFLFFQIAFPSSGFEVPIGTLGYFYKVL